MKGAESLYLESFYIKRSKETLKRFHKGSKTPKSLIKNGENFTT